MTPNNSLKSDTVTGLWPVTAPLGYIDASEDECSTIKYLASALQGIYQMNDHLSAANFFLWLAIGALVMAEFGWSSVFGDWQPTHTTAISYGVISIAFSSIARTHK